MARKLREFVYEERAKQADDRACLINIAAAALYLCGLEDHVKPSKVDKALKREPRQFPNSDKVLLYLLGRGLRVHTIGPPALNADKLAAGGVNYLKQYYGNDWRKSWEKYWTPRRIAITVADLRETTPQFNQQSRFSFTRRIPTQRDVMNALDGTQAVIVQARGNGPTVHSVLAFDKLDNTTPRIYDPEDGDVLRWPADQFKKEWVPSEGISIVSRD